MHNQDFSYVIISFLRDRNLTTKKGADYFYVSLKTISDWKNGSRKPGREKMEKIYKMIENFPFGAEPVPEFSFDKIIQSKDPRLLLIAIQSLLNCAYELAIEGAQAALSASFKPYVTLNPSMNLTHKYADDMPYSEDYFASEAIKQALKQYVGNSRHLLGYGIMVYDEESALSEIQGVNNNRKIPVSRKLIMFVDPLDGSYFWCGGRRIFGCSIVSFYHMDLGFLCAVCIDISGKRAYLKMKGMPAYAHSLYLPEDPANDKNHSDIQLMRGSILPLVSSSITSPTSNTVLNIYRITPRRELAYSSIVKKIDEAFSPKFIMNLSGTGGICLTAFGGISACIETAKGFGFRPWDFVGAFICSDNCFVCDEKGQEINFDTYRIKKEYILSGFMGDHMEKCRQKFVVAGTEELAKKLLSIIN